MRTVCIVALTLFVSCAADARVAEERMSAGKVVREQGQKQGSENDRLVDSVFQYSYTTAVQLSATDRVEVLVRLARVAGRKRPEKARQCALEALRLTREMDSTVQRAQYEIEAIDALAAVNSEEALQLLPALDSQASLREVDPRAKAARSVFLAFLNQHPGGWEKLSAVAQRIGDTGNYPFQAIQTVVGRIGSKNPEAAATLMLQAIYYYHLSEPSPASNNQLASLLAEDSKFVQASILKATLETILSSLLNADHATPENIAKTGKAENDETALNRDTLAMLLPLIDSIDPEMAQKLETQHPAPDSFVPSLESVVRVVGEAGSEPIILSPASLLPAGEVSTVFLLDSKAQASSETIDSAGLPAGEGAMQVVQNASPEDMTRLLDDSERALSKASDPEQRLQILTERGLSLVASKRWVELSNALEDAFSVGEELFRKSVDEDPKAKWSSRPGASELSTLVEAAAKSAPQIVLQRIRNLHASALQAELYVSFIEGMQSEQGSPTVIVRRAGDWIYRKNKNQFQKRNRAEHRLNCFCYFWASTLYLTQRRPAMSG